MIFTIKEFKNNSQAFNIPETMLKNFPKRVRQGFYQIGKNTKATATFMTKIPKTGRTYIIRSGRGNKVHIASAPSESHANVTGKLTKSISFDVNGSRSMSFGYDNSTKYGRALELGTPRMQARPTLLNAIKRAKRQNETIMTNSVRPENILYI